MKKENTVRSTLDFNRILNNKNKKLNSKYFMIAFEDSDKFQIGITVPKKNGNAVYRNKNKRQLKNIVHSINPYGINKKVIVIIKKDIDQLTFEQRKEQFKKQFSKLEK